MNDRQQVFVYLVAAALCLAGLFAVLRRTLWKFAKRPSALEPDNWRRWFRSGFGRVKGIYPVWLVLCVSAAIGTLAMIHSVWTTTRVPPNDPQRAAFFPPPRLGSWTGEIRWLGESALNGGSSMIPFPQVAALSVVPLLLIARRRKTFPYTRNGSIIRFWCLCGSLGWILFLFSWIGPSIPPVRAFIDRNLGNAPGFLFVLTAVIFLLLGFGLVLPLLYASIDTRIDASLSDSSVSVRGVFLSLAAIQFLLWIGSAPGSALLFLRGGLPGSAHKFFSDLDLFLGLTLVPFLFTATFLASTSLSLKETVLRNFAWWRTEFVFFVALLLGTGLANGVDSLILRGLFGALPGEGIEKTASFYAIQGVASLAISVFSFSFLLGNWVEQESRPADSHEGAAIPVG